MKGLKTRKEKTLFNLALFLFLVAFLLLAGNIVYGSIGCIEQNELLKCWNEGSIALNGTTYFNMTSGLLQQANTPERLKDVTYYYGLSRNISGSFYFWGLDEIPAGISYHSDNLTYYWAKSQEEIHIGAFTGYASKNNSQNLNDDYVLMNYTFMGNRQLTGQYFFTTAMIDMDISRDNKTEYLIIGLSNGSYLNWPMNQSWYNITENVTDVSVHGNFSYHLLFPEPITLIFDNTLNKVNGDLYFLHYIGSIEKEKYYHYGQYWIDPPCSISCDPATTVIITYSPGFTDIYIDEVKSDDCKYRILSFGGGGCSFSPGCSLQIDRNISSTYTILNNIATNQIRCYGQSFCNLYISAIDINVFYDYNITGYLTGQARTGCSISGYYREEPSNKVVYMLEEAISLPIPQRYFIFIDRSSMF